MHKSLLLQEESKTILRYSIILLLLSATVWIMYELISHRLVTSMYNGTSISILNNLIKYQSTKPVEHYIGLANKIFYKLWLLFGVALPILCVLSRYINFRQTCRIDKEPSKTEETAIAQSPVWSCRHIVIIAILSLVIRAAFLPFVTDLSTCGDATYYWAVPKFLANGEFYNTITRPPLWGYLLSIPAFIYDHIMSGRILAVCIGSCAPVLLYLLAAKIFNRKTAILAAILYVFFPTHIGYSHCLWSEIFFGVLLLLSTLFFFLFLEDTTKKKYFLLCFVTTGLTLLTKEFAVVIFGAFFLILIFSRLDNKFKKLVLATVLFMVPAVIYSVTASCLTKKIIVLNDAIIINFQAGAGNWGDYSYESREEDVGNLLDALKQRGVKNTVKNSIRQASSLWAPKSFISTRVASRPVPGWDYGIENPKPLVYLISGYYVFLVLTAIPGICLGKNDTFKFFSIACLSLLTATSVLALLVSRYRLPFMFVVIMYSAHFMTQGVSLFSREKRLFPLAWVLLLIMLFIDIVISTIPVLDQWG